MTRSFCSRYSRWPCLIFIKYVAYLQGSSRHWVDVMKEKRAIHEEIINLFHQQRSNNNHAEKVKISVV